MRGIRNKAQEPISKELPNTNSHEVKNTLTVIKANVYLLEKRLGKGADKKSLYYLTKIDKQINKLIELIKKG